MSKLKTPLLFASIGCIFSIFIGFLNHVHFFTMLVRGFAAGIISGAFTFGVIIVLKKMIPDLFEKKIDFEATRKGANVNITLDEVLEQPIAEPGLETSKDDASNDKSSNGVLDSSLNTIENPIVNEASEKNENPVVIDNDTASAIGEQVTDKVGDLPDIESFNTTDISQEDETGETVVANVSGLSMSDVQIPSADTKIMAEAIRTILKSDE